MFTRFVLSDERPQMDEGLMFAVGPFTTGLIQNGKDTGEGFKLSQIVENPSGFFADVHSSLAVPGAVRGQFT